MNDVKWDDVPNKKPMTFLLKEFSNYFIVAVIISICAVLTDGKIESDKYIMFPIGVVIITGCLYAAHNSIKRLGKLFK